MQQNPSWEANSHSDSKEIPSFMEPGGLVHVHKSQSPVPYPEPQ
jgi:hypothetical protein